MNKSRDESGVILSWFLKVGIFMLVIGVVLFDVGTIIVNNVSLSSSAEDVAIAVSIQAEEISSSPSSIPDFQIFTMAKEVVDDEANGVAGARVLKKGTFVDDQDIVHVRLRRRADTLITHFIGPLEKRTIAIVDGQAGT